jgi:hypothetical protein
MRTLLIGVLAATVVGCSCPPLPRQVSMQGCTDANGFACLDRTTAGQSIEQDLALSSANSATAKIATAKTKHAASAEKRSSAHPRDKTHHATETAKVEPPASTPRSETADPVLDKAKITIAARLAEPASAEFGEMKRAMRKNTLGQSVDTICGRVKGKTASGEDIGDRPFLYLVKDDEAYVVDGGAAGSAAAAAYRNICN